MAAELEPSQLRRRCNPEQLGFSTTAELAPLAETLGQARAAEAVAFGLDIGSPGFNVVATGPMGTGKRSMLELYLEERARTRPRPKDLVYVYNFDEPRQPMALELEPGTARQFADDCGTLVESARRRIRDAFESESYTDRRNLIRQELEARGGSILEELQAYARERELGLELTPAGAVTVPLLEGKPVSPQRFERMTKAFQEQYHQNVKDVQGHLTTAMGQLRQIEREGDERLRALDAEVAQFAVGDLVDELKERWRTVERLESWLDRVLADMVGNLPRLRSEPSEDAPEPVAEAFRHSRERFFARYEANVTVSNDSEGAPVVFAPEATFYDLFGRVEYESSFGAVSTDHRFIRGGALHRARGGYLVLEALNVLTQPFVWHKLKEALRTGRLRIENVGAQYMLFPTATLEPEPVGLDVKVVLVAPPDVYRLLYLLDEDVRKLFKVKADFAVDMPWGEDEERGYAAYIRRHVEHDGLLHLDAGAVARVIEQGARSVGDQGRLSTRFGEIADLVTEASHWAAQTGAEVVAAEHVETAIERKLHRSNLLEERVRDLIAEGTLLIDVDGARIGQLNGVAVASVGDYEFGHPARVTATVSAGDGEMVNIDRETELSGPIHDKGFLILAGIIRDRYCRDTPLSLKASLVFEQSYDEVEGDSAACAELLAVLSALAEAPLRQDLAVTGSVNQHGQIQPVGAVNAKIEGFYEVCLQAGLTGEQGVLIPAANVRHLMLKPDVVEAVDAGRFHVWAVGTVEEALELMTGLPAGERAPGGEYPDGTLNRRVEDRLLAMSEAARKLHGGPEGAPDGQPPGGLRAQA